MSLPAFPSIRAPSSDGWRGATGDGRVRTSMDAGPDKTRVDSTAVPGVESFTYKLSAADRDTLEQFIADHGAERFTYTHGVWGACEARFSTYPAWTKKGLWFTASFQLEIYR